MLHAIAKTAKVRADVKVAVQGGQGPDPARFEKGAQAPDALIVAPILDDGQYLARLLGGLHHLAGMGHRVGQGLFPQHVASVGQGLQRYGHVRFGHRAVEHHVWAGAVEHGGQVVADQGIGQRVLVCFLARRLLVDIHQADHAHRVHGLDGVEPGATDPSTSYQYGSHWFHVSWALLPRCAAGILPVSLSVRRPCASFSC